MIHDLIPYTDTLPELNISRPRTQFDGHPPRSLASGVSSRACGPGIRLFLWLNGDRNSFQMPRPLKSGEALGIRREKVSDEGGTQEGEDELTFHSSRL